MKFKTILKNHSEFESSVEEIIRYALEKIIIGSDRITVRERDMSIEAFILKLCALWESFLEEEIILAVSLDPTILIDSMELSKSHYHLDIKLIRAILFSDAYRSFQDVNRLTDFTKDIIVEKYNPFLKITKEQRTKIHFTYSIRNYLSHYSNFSKKKLFSEYKKIYNYKKFLEPNKFLVKNKGKHFEDLANNFKISSLYMRKIFT